MVTTLFNNDSKLCSSVLFAAGTRLAGPCIGVSLVALMAAGAYSAASAQTAATAPAPARNAARANPAPAASSVVNLDTINVTGAPSATGPVEGYIATNSATGTKTDTPLIRTPQSISVVTRDQVEAQGAQSVTQALRYTSGLAAEVRGTASRYDIPYIRGFGSPTDPVQFLDGMRLLRGGGYAFPQVDPYGVERIEFLKGPSSVLYGGSVPGGLINLVSKRPTATPQREIQLLYGSHERMQAAFDLSGPVLGDETLLYRIVGLARQSDTQVVNTKEGRSFIAPSFTWAPTADTKLTVSGSYQHDPDGGYYGVLPTIGTLWPSPAGRIRRSFNDGDPAFSSFDRKQAMIGYAFEHRFNEILTLRHNLRYLDLTTATRDVTTNGLLADGHTIPRYALGQNESIRGLTSDLQLEAKFDTGPLRHKALLGFDHVHSTWKQIRNYGNAPSIDYLNPVYGVASNLQLAQITNQRQQLNQSGIYLQDQISFDRLTLTLSGRRDAVDMTTRNHLNGTRQKQKDDAYSGRIGLIYNFDNGIAPYASYSTSFLPVSGTDAAGKAFQPTTAEQYELGVKYQPVGYNALFTLAYFDITQKNVVTALNPLVRYQSGEQRSRGVEFEAKVAVTESFNLIGAFTYTKAQITRSLGADAGDYPVGVPDYTASLWADYAFGPGYLHGLKIGGGVRYVGETVGGYAPNAFVPNPTRLDVPGYTLVDAAVSYDFGKSFPRLTGLTAKLNVNNLFDRTYVTCLANNFCNYGHGRSAYATLTYRW